MRVFWERGAATSAEVVEALRDRIDWKPRTIRTMIGRLEQKGALTFEEKGREYVYRPAIDEKICEQAASRTFLDRVFSGKLAPFLATFVENGDYSEEDIAELKRVLEKREPT